jgi:hypothetical protein
MQTLICSQFNPLQTADQAATAALKALAKEQIPANNQLYKAAKDVISGKDDYLPEQSIRILSEAVEAGISNSTSLNQRIFAHFNYAILNGDSNTNDFLEKIRAEGYQDIINRLDNKYRDYDRSNYDPLLEGASSGWMRLLDITKTTPSELIFKLETLLPARNSRS